MCLQVVVVVIPSTAVVVMIPSDGGIGTNILHGGIGDGDTLVSADDAAAPTLNSVGGLEAEAEHNGHGDLLPPPGLRIYVAVLP